MSDSPEPTRAELVERFTRELDRISWGYLSPHYDRDAVIIVDKALDLIEIACDVAQDQGPLIEEHIQQGRLVKPKPAHIEKWQKTYTVFDCLIVQPFVLAQERPAAD